MTGAERGTALERHYRRLLAWYPAGHRRVYGEEMIGVLMASAPPGRDRPDTGEVLNLVGGGLRARLRRSRTGGHNPAWRDALAVFSVVAPVVLLSWLTSRYLAGIAWQSGHPLYSRFQELVSTIKWALLPALITTAVLVPAVAVWPLLARRGHARANAVLGVITVAAVILSSVVETYRFVGPAADQFTLFFTLIAVMEVVALLGSPGPARGWRLLSRRGVIVLAAISVVVIAVAAASGTRHEYWNLNIILDLSGAITVLGVALTLPFKVGVRLMALWAIPGYQFLGFAPAPYLFTEFESRYVPTAVIAVVVFLAAWRSCGRGERQSEGSAENLDP